MKLLTNNPDKVQNLVSEGVHVVERLEMRPKILTQETLAYLNTKVERMNHILGLGVFNLPTLITPKNVKHNLNLLPPNYFY